MAETVYEFFHSLYSTLPPELVATVAHMDIEDDEDGIEHDADTAAELPAPSPDSITVTTEFGVSEEPTNITIITGGAPPPPAPATEAEVETGTLTLEDLNQNMLDMGSAPLEINTEAPVATNITIQMHTDTDADADETLGDEGEDEDADVDTDDFDAVDFDAESVIIDGLFDEGALTPTTGTTSTTTI